MNACESCGATYHHASIAAICCGGSVEEPFRCARCGSFHADRGAALQCCSTEEEIVTDGGVCRGDTDRFADPYEQKLAGETEVVFQCGTAASEHEEVAEMCEHDAEKIELDGPAYIDERGNVHLPGRPVECPVCGNPHEFRFNGLVVMFV